MRQRRKVTYHRQRKMNAFYLQVVSRLSIWTFIILIAFSAPAFAQREYTVVKPRERSATERVTIRTKAAQASKGILAVILQPVFPGQTVVVKDSTGKVIGKQEGIQDGQAEFQLQRGKVYQVEASHPGYLSATGKSKALKSTEIIRLRLVPQFVSFNLGGLPSGAQVFIDDKLKATVDQNGLVSIGEIEPGKHVLRISHPEYNDYKDYLNNEELEAGVEVNYSRIPLTRVAKLLIQGPAGATVLINGAVQGRIQENGSVRIDYELEQASERTISVEQLGYQTWTRTETLTPGPHTITVNLDPIVTSAGVSDFFDSLSQWKAPATWELVTEGRNKKLRVHGKELGVLKDKTYRDILGGLNFTIWLEDGKGATWAVRVDKDGRNYYLFHLAGPNSTTHTPKRLYTYLVRDGGAPVEVSTPIPVLTDLNTKASYTINIEVAGYTVTQWITSNETGDKGDLGIWTDTTATKDKFLYGTFGFCSLAGEVFTVDDFNLEPNKQQ